MTDLVTDAELEAELRALAPLLARIATPEPTPALVERTRRLAVAQLGFRPALAPGVASAHEGLPRGFRRELLRLVVATLPGLALLLAWDAFLLREGAAWLAAFLPAGVALALVAAHVVGGLGWIGLTYASLPLVAHRRTLLRPRSSDA
jgi:hypothetical protein